jgi:NADH:ubiquinone oxidoreductase subunit 5 (subunit L)/multisubunit Na+/H+ antiporter MnhA subunit
MEAPVPASALIHSATLVSAGIYLILRLNKLFEVSYMSHVILLVIGSTTAFYGGFVSMFQSDVKRVLAYSTISHCGFLMTTLGLGIYEYTIIYLYVHGFFKAATFLNIGNVIRFSGNIQDFKKMGLYSKYLPFEAYATFVCLLNLGGLPLTMGFFIKHLVLIGMDGETFISLYVFINCFLGALTGLFYSSRLYFNIFLDKKKSRKANYYSTNRKNLKSTYYSNSSYAGILSILLLIILAYYIIIVMIFFFLSKNFFFSDLYSIIIRTFFVDYY